MHTARRFLLALFLAASAPLLPLLPSVLAQSVPAGSPSGYGANGFGGSVALSADGTTALVGAYGKSGGNGAAYVFRYSPGGWTLQAKLVADDGALQDWFGWAVALSADGRTALIGALGKDNQTGAAYMFGRHAGHWTEIQELRASDSTRGDDFGRSVALNASGSIALVGADRHQGGAAYTFARYAAGWREGQTLTPRDESSQDHFGVSVALSGDGKRALVGAYNWHGESGAAYVFDDHGSTGWNQQGDPLSGAYRGAADFGLSVALSADGETALIGSPWADFQSGVAYVFGYTSAGWVVRQRFTPHDPTPPSIVGWVQKTFRQLTGDRTLQNYFGWRVALSADGRTAVIGVPWQNAAAGTAYVFGRSADGWREKQVLSQPTGRANQQFGMAVATSKDGRTLLIGAEGAQSILDTAYSYTRTAASKPHWGAHQRLGYFHLPLLKSLPARHTYTTSPASFTSVGPLATDSAGDLFVADEHACRLVEFASSGAILHIGGTGAGQFNRRYVPCIGGLAVAPSGNILATDTWDGRVVEFDPTGTVVRSWGRLNIARMASTPYQLYGPRGLAIGPDGKIYVADTGHSRVQVFDAHGTFVRTIGRAGSALGELSEPSSLAIDASGRVFVADYWHDRVQVFSALGTPQTSFTVDGWQAGSYAEPQIAVDSQGRILAPIPDLGLMLLYAHDGTLLYGWRTAAGVAGNASKPLYATVDAAGLAWVADSAGNAVTSFRAP